MPSLKELFSALREDLDTGNHQLHPEDRHALEERADIVRKLNELEELVTPVVKRYDFMRGRACKSTGIPEADFDHMTDLAMQQAAEAPEPSRIILP